MIPLAITCAAVPAFVLAGASGPRQGLFLLVALFPLLPYYFAIPIGGGGAGFAAARLGAYALCAMILVQLALAPGGWQPAFRALLRQSWILWLAAGLALARLVSTLAHQPLGALYYWADELVLLGTVFLLSVRTFLDLPQIERLGRLLAAAALLQVVLVLVETALGHHLLSGLVDIEVSTVGAEVLDGRIRDGLHRAQALFDNPLSLAEYLLYMALAVVFLRDLRRPRRRAGTWALLGLIGLAILQTRARFPVLLMGGSLIVFWLLALSARLAPGPRLLLRAGLLAGGSAVAVVAWGFVTRPDRLLALFGGDAASDASLVSRGLQYALISESILSQSGGLLGEGYRSDLIERLGLKLDSFYLRLLIEGGLPALFCFVAMMAGLVGRSLGGLRRARGLALAADEQRALVRLHLFFLFFFIQAAFAKLFLSMVFNNYLLALVAGALVAVQARMASVPPRQSG
ncbi:hypothetical protein [Rhodovulum sulfidophilum]|uniref:O-antigen ligase family protein n=2 Tax=Rhodovulum sulfidophilum TaxID=35806 RepID=A0ABS1RW60_RHOSU|nr:hypothetical protein [Rhodovulum sulfidophilum]MBL3610315.1 hypothetical protein [Rhodovulum sulfidophilum]MCE8420935.1 hypothetical protein [Rhodovulum sulfidophilum]